MAGENESSRAALPAQTTETGKVSLNDGTTKESFQYFLSRTNKGNSQHIPRKERQHDPTWGHRRNEVSSTFHVQAKGRSLFWNHITVLTVDPPMFQCEICTKKFKTKAHQKYHKFCQIGDTPFKCELCGKGMIAKSHYEYHLRKHSGELPYVCKICNRRFIAKGKLNTHMMSHTGEKRFVCQQCNREFANSQNLKMHTYIHSGERRFPCTKCPNGEKNFLCNHCGASFSQRNTLDFHLTSHSNNRPHSCGQCTRAFKTTRDLKSIVGLTPECCHSGVRFVKGGSSSESPAPL
ncbi:putative zinc finger protein [Orchesella cincta]|uniref:Putative zinc finger protein n=1 Tax=Orchesella cincta TaxID=48709 RepID=A0A1D2MF28_ORCCI|nr:putative zinc finger protein [Orchesella cincta]